MEASAEDLAIEPGQSAPETAVSSQSVLDKIKKRRDERSDTEKFDIPSWGGDLQAEYEVVDRSEIEKMIRRVRARANGAGGGVEADANFLVSACIGLYANDPETDEEVRVADGFTLDFARDLEPTYPKDHPQEGEPVPIRTPQELVVYLVKWNSVALASHSQKVARWMQDTSKPVEDPT